MLARVLFVAGFFLPWLFFLDAPRLTLDGRGNRFVRRSRNVLRIRLAELAVVALWIALEVTLDGPRLSRLLDTTPSALAWASVPVVWLGGSLAVWSKLTLGRYFSGTFAVKEGHRLITHGPYRLVRHPIYLGLVLMLLALALQMNSLVALAALALPMTLMLRLQIREEERLFAETMGEDFARYRRRVPALVPWPRRARRLWALAAAFVALAAWAARPAPDLAPLPGRLVAARFDTLVVFGGNAHFRFELESDRGIVSRGRAREPVDGPLPRQLVVLLDGQEIGADAVDALPEDRGTLAVALDYPELLEVEVPVWKAPAAAHRARRAARRAAESLLLAIDHFTRRPDVDSTRVALVGASFGVPVATIVASLEPRVDAVALVYGGGDIARLIEANLAIEPRALRWALARWGAWALRPLEPARYAGRIAPRPLVLVSGEDDPQVPRECVEALYRAAREPKKIVWLPTGHLDPSDPALLERLAAIAIESLPVLARTPPDRP